MKKIILFLLITFLFFSCVGEKNNKDNTNSFLTGVVIEQDNLKIEKKLKKDFKKTEKETEDDNIKELKYKEIIDYSKVNIKNITENFLNDDIEDEYILVDLQFEKSHKKLEKILTLINVLAYNGKINSFELHCKNLNFNNNELNILKNIKFKTIILEDICGFKKDNFSGTWYNKEKIINFLKNSKNIKELYIGSVDMDLFKKENGEIKVYSED